MIVRKRDLFLVMLIFKYVGCIVIINSIKLFREYVCMIIFMSKFYELN